MFVMIVVIIAVGSAGTKGLYCQGRKGRDMSRWERVKRGNVSVISRKTVAEGFEIGRKEPGGGVRVVEV